MNNWIKIENSKVIYQEKAISLKGVNFGSWLNIEDFMIGLSGCDYQIKLMLKSVLGENVGRQFINNYLENFITEEDVIEVKALGFNHIRIPFTYRLFENDLYPGSYEGMGFKYLDKLVQWCKKHKIHCLLDLHAAPGGQNFTPPADHANGEPALWFHKDFQDRTIALWEAIARNYKDEEWIMGFDLLNEPITDQLHDSQENKVDQMNNFYNKLIHSIRAIDKNHILVIEGNVRQSGGIDTLDKTLFLDKNTMCSFHFYPMFQLGSIPGLGLDAESIASDCNNSKSSKAGLKQSMQKEIDYAHSVNRPILLGEFGFFSDKDKKLQESLIKTQLEIAEEWAMHWTLWPWKDVGLMGLKTIKPDSPWKLFINSIEGKIKNAYEISEPAMEEVMSKFEKTDETKLIFDAAWNDITRGVRRMALSWEIRELKKLKEEDILEMPKSFLINNCQTSYWYETVLKGFLKN